jgi:hypothetical protein
VRGHVVRISMEIQCIENSCVVCVFFSADMISCYMPTGDKTPQSCHNSRQHGPRFGSPLLVDAGYAND